MAVVDNAGGITATAAGIQMGGLKVTGLAAGTVNGDAMRFEQIPIVGGGFAPGPNTSLDVFEDFAVITAAPINATIVQPSGITCDVSGGSGSLQTNTVTEQGLLRYSVSTNGQFYGFLVGGGNNKSFKLQTSDAFSFSVRTAIATVSDGTDNILAFHGFTSGAEALGNDALVVQHDRSIDATHWVFTIVVGGVVTNLITTTTITAGQLYVLEVVKLAGSNTITCYIDGTNVGTLTLTSPTAVMQGASYLKKVLGNSARTIDVDWLRWPRIWPSKRAASFLA